MAVNLSIAFSFNPASIDAAVKFKRPGVYALGYTTPSGVFVIQRVGRSDGDLASRLKSDEYKGRFQQFKAAYCDSADAAFHDECELYHRYGGSNNPNHPARPVGKTHHCNHCGLFS
jgi:hypothetical protein